MTAEIREGLKLLMERHIPPLTPQGLAKISGVHLSTISRILSGDIGHSATLPALFRALGRETAPELVEEEDERGLLQAFRTLKSELPELAAAFVDATERLAARVLAVRRDREAVVKGGELLVEQLRASAPVADESGDPK